MSNKVLCLSGWGQKHNSLEFIFNDSAFDPFFLSEISSVNYSNFDSIENFFNYLERRKINSEIIIGWSLGGQLALRLIEKKILQPRLLILIASPFQMVKDQNIQAAMSQGSFDEFYQNFVKAPNKTLRQFSILTAMNDQNSAEISKNLDINDQNFLQLKFWLEELRRFSAFNLDFSKMPRTILFQGAGDMIVHASQSEYFKKRITNFRLEIFQKCGHAPHLSDIKLLRKIIIEELIEIAKIDNFL